MSFAFRPALCCTHCTLLRGLSRKQHPASSLSCHIPISTLLPPLLPTVIAHFLEDFRANGTFTGFPALGVQWQRMESEALRCAALCLLACAELSWAC